MSEASNLPEGGERFTMGSTRNFVLVRYPASVLPPDGTVCFVETGGRQSAGMFKDGKWTNGRGKALRFEPTHWTAIDRAGE